MSSVANPSAVAKPNIDHLPADLRARKQWVLWRYEDRDGKLSKVPFRFVNPSSRASSTDPSAWGPLGAVPEGYGVGYVLTEGEGLVCLDLDWKDAGLDEMPTWAHTILETLPPTYTEWSVSGRGLHLFYRARLPKGHRTKFPVGEGQALEVFTEGRYIALTGNLLPESTHHIQEAQEAISSFYENLLNDLQAKQPEPFRQRAGSEGKREATRPLAVERKEDRAILDCCLRSGSFQRLWSGDWDGKASHSEADLALCWHLALHTDDAEQIDRIFRSSGLYRPKWDKADYRHRTISKAIEAAEARKFRDSRPAGHAAQELPDFGTVLRDANRWAGHAGESNRRVYEALVVAARKSRSAVVSIGQARLAEATNMEVRTIRRALKRLEASGLVTRLERGSLKGNRVSRYRLEQPPAVLKTVPPTRRVAKGDTFEHFLSGIPDDQYLAPGRVLPRLGSSLKRITPRILMALDELGSVPTVEALADYLKVSRNTVGSACKSLLAQGILTRPKGLKRGYCLTDQAHSNYAIAVLLGGSRRAFSTARAHHMVERAFKTADPKSLSIRKLPQTPAEKILYLSERPLGLVLLKSIRAIQEEGLLLRSDPNQWQVLADRVERDKCFWRRIRGSVNNYLYAELAVDLGITERMEAPEDLLDPDEDFEDWEELQEML